MMCKNPYFNKDQGFWCPCGSCPYCRKQRAMEWSLRVSHELVSTGDLESTFVTLTYDPEHLPTDNSLKHEDWQLFFKRLRKNLGYPVRFFMCGEYGEKRSRPHYHAIIFGLNHKDADLHVNKAWGLGSVDLGYQISRATGSYIAGYISKKMKTKSYGDRKPPYVRCSQGIGRQFCDFFSSLFLGNGFCQDATTRCKYAIPRYYFKRLGIDRREYYKDIIKDKNLELLKEIERRAGKLIKKSADILPLALEKIDKNKFILDSNNILDTISQGWYIQIDDSIFVMNEVAKTVMRQIRNAKNFTIEFKLKQRERMDL